jgi:WD40 repeat protein/tetratricopeptide (TPR) repeat protein
MLPDFPFESCGRDPLPETNPMAGRSRAVWPRRVPVAIVALAATAAVGALIDGSAASVLVLGPPARADAVAEEKQNEDADAMTTRSLLVVVRAGMEGETQPVVFLRRPACATDASKLASAQVDPGILVREIARQAILIAARDELGLATRDEMLGDAPPAGEVSARAEVASQLRTGQPASLVIARTDVGPKTVLLKSELLPPESASNVDIIALAAAAEALSRSKLPGVLKLLGLEGQPNPVRPEAELPRLVEDRLESLGFVAPLAAIRSLHAAIRADGESPARLGALVRGYARLGVLTEFLWTPAHQVFKARALLYAQRLIARDEKSPSGLWHRAYAEALMGLHQKALDDLAAARTLVAGKDAPSAPPWVDLIAAHCHFDLASLRNTQGPQGRFAALLRMLAQEFPLSLVSSRAATAVLALDPECFRAYDVICEVGGIGNLHSSTVTAPQTLDRVVPRQVRGIETLPLSVRYPIDIGANENALTSSLDQAGAPGEDAGEPSWAVLASLIRETRFVHVYRRLSFMRSVWGVPVGEFWDASRPLVDQHRFLPYLLSIVLNTPEANRAFADSVDDSALLDLELTTATPLIAKLVRTDAPKGKNAELLAQGHSSALFRDAAYGVMKQSGDPSKVSAARRILTLSPECPFAMATLIEKDWGNAKPHVAEWEKKATDSPALIAALGRRYSALQQYDKAREYLLRYIHESREAWAYQRLANNYKEQGDTDHWLETLDKFLAKGDDPGLSKASIGVEIANYYMSQRNWTRAQPYAETAAQSWAQWAMQCARRCYEGMRDWDQVVVWQSRETDRYTGEGTLYRWYQLCKRTGRGNAAAARDFVEQYLAADANRAKRLNPENLAFYYWLSGSRPKALGAFRRAYEEKSSILAARALVMIADDLGDRAQRDAMLNNLSTKHRAAVPNTSRLFQMFRDSLSTDPPGALDLKAVDQIIAKVTPDSVGDFQFFVGWFPSRHGDPDAGREYLKRSTQSRVTSAWLHDLANDALGELGTERALEKYFPLVTPAGDRKDVLKQVRRIPWPGNHIYHTAFSRDGRLYLGGGDTGTLRIWEVASGNQLFQLPVPIGLFTPDGKQVVGHKGGMTLFVFDLTSGQVVRTWSADSNIVSAAIAPDGKQVVTAHADKRLRVWDLASGKENQMAAGPSAPAVAVFSPDGKQILSAGSDKTVWLLDLERNAVVRTFDDFQNVSPLRGQDLIVQPYFLPGSQIAAYVWGNDKTLLVWDSASGKVVRTLELGSDHHKDLAISPDGRWLLTGHDDRTVRLRDLATGKEVQRVGLADVNVPRALHFSPDGRFAVAGSHRGWVYLWEVTKQ